MRRRRIAIVLVIAAGAGLATYALSSPAPYRLSAQPVTAYRVLPLDDRVVWGYLHGPEPARPTFRGYPVFASKPMPEQLRTALIRILESSKTYTDPGHGGACFEPRLGFSFGEGESRVEILICLECHWVYFYKGDSVRYKALSPRGVSELTPIAEALFGPQPRLYLGGSWKGEKLEGGHCYLRCLNLEAGRGRSRKGDTATYAEDGALELEHF
jgi:hypothetical protein